MLPLPAILTTKIIIRGSPPFTYRGVGLTAKDRGSLATLCSLTMVSQESQTFRSLRSFTIHESW